MLRHYRATTGTTAGFSLVELLIALVVGLIVLGAVLALIVSTIRANSQTIQATRLTQELRATASVIASDLKRAGGATDSFAAAVKGNEYAAIVPSSGTASCIRYGYAGAAGGGYHAVRLNNRKVELVTANTFAGASCDINGQSLSSTQVDISEMNFTVSGRKIDMTLTGSLTSPDSDLALITRTLSQTIFVRSDGT